MKKLLARARALWAREPVLVATAAPILVSLGLVTQAQVSTVTKALTAGAALVVQLAAAFGARSKVKPAPKPAEAPPAAAK